MDIASLFWLALRTHHFASQCLATFPPAICWASAASIPDPNMYEPTAHGVRIPRFRMLPGANTHTFSNKHTKPRISNNVSKTTSKHFCCVLMALLVLPCTNIENCVVCVVRKSLRPMLNTSNCMSNIVLPSAFHAFICLDFWRRIGTLIGRRRTH